MSDQNNNDNFDPDGVVEFRAVPDRMRQPRLSLGQVAAASGAPISTLRNWVDRKRLRLDAEEQRQEGKHRRFSTFDAVKVAVAHSLTEQGVAAAAAAAASEVVLNNLNRHPFANASFRPKPILYVDLTCDPPRVTPTFNKARFASFAVDLEEILRRVLALTGEDIAVGTAEQIRAHADRVEKRGDDEADGQS